MEAVSRVVENAETLADCWKSNGGCFDAWADKHVVQKKLHGDRFDGDGDDDDARMPRASTAFHVENPAHVRRIQRRTLLPRHGHVRRRRVQRGTGHDDGVCQLHRRQVPVRREPRAGSTRDVFLGTCENLSGAGLGTLRGPVWC